MAELLLKVGDRSARPDDWKDGDVMCAFNGRRIRCCHAQHLCHIKHAPRNSSGLILLDALSRDWFEATHQYRFERVSPNQLRRRDLFLGTDELFSDKPNERGEAIDVGLFVRRRKQKPTHGLFGVDGKEIWYGGRVDVSNATLNVVWAAIEGKSPAREVNFRRWPMGILDVRSHLPVAVDDFDDAEAVLLESPEVDDTDPEKPIIVQRRLHKLDYRIKAGLSARDLEKVLDSREPFDLREVRELTRATAIERKPKKTDRTDNPIIRER